MNFSELEALTSDTGLSWDGERLCLFGRIKDYPVYITDLQDSREYLLTVFCRLRADAGASLTDGISGLIEGMPKNCVNGRKNELKYQQIRFNAVMLYQENAALLSDFVLELCGLADSLGILPEEEDAALAVPPKNEDRKRPAAKKPKNAVSKGFDKYSMRGLIGAAVGGAAMAVISSTMADNNPSNTGAMIAGWAAGGLIALVTLADYIFLAKKMDIFGTIACTLVTAASCFFCSLLGIARIMTHTAQTLDSSVTFNDTLHNWQAYSVLFPDVPGYIGVLLLKNFFTAAVASAVFYILYFRRHQSIMYADGEEFLPEDETEKKKKSGKKPGGGRGKRIS